jgi:(E)-4-hydroxy-3-methylbut-2-enyl-diphosphate synthase
VEEVIRKAKDKGVAIRVGINGGSLPKELRNEADMGMAMLKAAEKELELLEKYDFTDVLFSLKSSSIEATIKANWLFAEKYTYPLHLGVTEAGPLIAGIVKSSIALAEMLKQGIGDTVRISLSDTPLNEVLTAKEILKACGLSKPGITIISCPTCGRTDFDVRRFLNDILPFLQKQEKSLTVAIMGCPVNGPGEAKHADLGITGTEKYAVIFKEGKIMRRVSGEQALDAFKEEISHCQGK